MEEEYGRIMSIVEMWVLYQVINGIQNTEAEIYKIHEED